MPHLHWASSKRPRELSRIPRQSPPHRLWICSMRHMGRTSTTSPFQSSPSCSQSMLWPRSSSSRCSASACGVWTSIGTIRCSRRSCWSSSSVLRSSRWVAWFAPKLRANTIQRVRTLTEFRTMSITPYNIHVFRDGKWKEISTSDLVPGDLASIRGSLLRSTKFPDPRQSAPNPTLASHATCFSSKAHASSTRPCCLESPHRCSRRVSSCENRRIAWT